MAVSSEQIEKIVKAMLVKLGWTACENQTAIASKSFRTEVGVKVAYAYISKGDEFIRVLSGNYQSKGHNILSNQSVMLPVETEYGEYVTYAREFAANVEETVEESYARKLLKMDPQYQTEQRTLNWLASPGQLSF